MTSLHTIVNYSLFLMLTHGQPYPCKVKPEFDSALNAIRALSEKQNTDDFDIHSIPFGRELMCKACRLTMQFFLSSHNWYVPDQVTATALVRLCSVVQTISVCRGLVELNMPVFIEILKVKPDLSAQDVCETIFEEYCAKNPVIEWNINIPNKTETTEETQSAISKSSNESIDVTNKTDILHITDTHVDPLYEAGSIATGCREPICCRNYQGLGMTSTNTAGYWGEYKSCDIPIHTLENLLYTVAAYHKTVKYIYMTGDLIAHNVWDTTKEKNINQIQEQAAMFFKILDKGVQIFPVIGNHEPHPANVLCPSFIPEYSGEWLYEVFYDSWCKHLPPETKLTFMKGGYYTVSPEPGFRIIALNYMHSYTFNWCNIVTQDAAASQLQWFSDTMLEAELKGEKVHILTHGPPAETDTLRTYRREYDKIITRFSHVVAGQFMGHTHRDQIYIHYKPETLEPCSVAWNAGSVTPYTNVNPNYRTYSVNKYTWEVDNVVTYIYNLTEANENPDKTPRWFELYSFKEAYNISSLRPKDIHTLVTQLVHDNELFKKYFLFYFKNSDVAYKKDCDKHCQKNMLCKTVYSPDGVDKGFCEYILQ